MQPSENGTKPTVGAGVTDRKAVASAYDDFVRQQSAQPDAKPQQPAQNGAANPGYTVPGYQAQQPVYTSAMQMPVFSGGSNRQPYGSQPAYTAQPYAQRQPIRSAGGALPYSYQGWGTAESNSRTAQRRKREKPQQAAPAAARPSGPSELSWKAPRGGASDSRFVSAPANGKRASRNVQQKKPGGKAKWIILAVLLLALGAGFAVASDRYSEVKAAVAKYDNVFMDNVYVDGICLGGMTYEEGSRLIWDHVNLKKSNWYVRIRNEHGEYNDITAETLGINFDPTQALNDAWAVGRAGYSGVRETLERRSALAQINAQTYSFSSVEQSADSAPIGAILSTLEQAAYRAPVDAQFLGFDPDDTANPFKYSYEQYGQRLNTEGIKEQIMSYADRLECGEVLLQVEPIAPRVTVNDLSVNHELRAVAYTPISSHSTEDRTDNIRLAFSKINGRVLNDGEKFSFNKTVGRRSLENGFKAAVEYQYGEEEWGIGGGVCQASTTVYLAACNGGMTIKNRRPHSMAVSYTDLGLDCTVSDTRGHEIDFTFVNNTGAPVYISAHVIGRTSKNLQCEVRMYGATLNGKKYQLVAETVEVLPKPDEPTYVKDKQANYVTYDDQTKTIEGREGYKVQSRLITYQNGVACDSRDMYLDVYQPKADTVYVGVTPRGGV